MGNGPEDKQESGKTGDQLGGSKDSGEQKNDASSYPKSGAESGETSTPDPA